MAIEVFSRHGQALSRLIPRVNVVGGGLLRLRSVSFLLFGLVTAIGLGLVVFISLQGWPSVLSGPIPGAPAPQLGAVHNGAIDRAPPGGLRGQEVRDRVVSRGERSTGLDVDAPSTGDSGLAGSRQVAQTPAPGPVAEEPPAHGGDPAPPVASPSPTPSPSLPTSSQPVSSAPVAASTDGGKSKGEKKSGGGKERSKAKDASPSKSKGGGAPASPPQEPKKVQPTGESDPPVDTSDSSKDKGKSEKSHD